jgi:hypothetical protein
VTFEERMRTDFLAEDLRAVDIGTI